MTNIKTSTSILLTVMAVIISGAAFAGTKFHVRALTHNAYNDDSPQINGSGQVAWTGVDGTDFEIYLYDGTTTIQLTDNDYFDAAPEINASGQVVWYGSPFVNEEEIFL